MRPIEVLNVHGKCLQKLHFLLENDAGSTLFGDNLRHFVAVDDRSAGHEDVFLDLVEGLFGLAVLVAGEEGVAQVSC